MNDYNEPLIVFFSLNASTLAAVSFRALKIPSFEHFSARRSPALLFFSPPLVTCVLRSAPATGVKTANYSSVSRQVVDDFSLATDTE